MSQRQQNGYVCSIVSRRSSVPSRFMRCMIAASASFTNTPSISGHVVPVNFPAASTGTA